MKSIRKIITCFLCLFFPTKFIFWILNLMGHQIHFRSKIGFSFLWISESIVLEKNSKIGHLNRIKIHRLNIDEGAYIGSFNNMVGPVEIELAKTAAIGNSNSIYRAPIGVTYGKAVLRLGTLSKITANHRVDCTRNVIIGEYSTIAGHETQIWTHAYYHDKSGPGRFRLDGEVIIGNNVYIGSRCILNMGVEIIDTVVVGANSSISKSILEPGTYVNQALRKINGTIFEDARKRYKKIDAQGLCEEVYEKNKNKLC